MNYDLNNIKTNGTNLPQAESLELHTMTREPIELADYPKSRSLESRFDPVAKARYPEAAAITPLIRKKKLSPAQSLLDFVLCPGIFQTADSLTDRASWYLVEAESRQYLVKVSKDFLETRTLATPFRNNDQLIDGSLFSKALYRNISGR